MKRKKSKCQLDNLLVLTGKTLPQCTVGDLSVVCTMFCIHQKNKRQLKHPSFMMFRVTLLAVLVKYKKRSFIFTKNEYIYLVLAYKQYH